MPFKANCYLFIYLRGFLRKCVYVTALQLLTLLVIQLYLHVQEWKENPVMEMFFLKFV